MQEVIRGHAVPGAEAAELPKSPRDQLRMLANYDLNAVIGMLFKDAEGKPFKCTRYQLRMLKKFLSRKHKKILFLASTRAGKSEIISIAIVLFGIMYPNEEIWVISATTPQSEIIFERAKNHSFDSPIVAAMVDMSKEFSGRKIHYKNGSSIECKSAHAGSRRKGEEGEGLLGEGGTVIVLDETGSIEDSIYYTKILRMIAAARRERFLLESGTPHHRNHIYETSINPEYEVIHVDCYEAASEGQISLEEINSIRERISEIEFEMWYLAKFPTDTEDSLIKSEWISRAILRPEEFPVWDEDEHKTVRRITSSDVARFGTDKTTVYTRETQKATGKKYVRQIKEYSQQDTMTTVDKIAQQHIQDKTSHIYTDVGGLGAGIFDRLKELGYPVTDVNFGSSPVKDKERFLNLKAELYQALAKEFEAGRMKIPNERTLINQLRKMRFEIRSDKKMRIIDPEDKSPDHADALAISMMDDLSSGKVIIRSG